MYANLAAVVVSQVRAVGAGCLFAKSFSPGLLAHLHVLRCFAIEWW